MKKILAFLATAMVSLGAAASPATFLPAGPVYLKFSGAEQMAVGGASTWTDGKEVNWGVIVMSTMEAAAIASPNGALKSTGDIFFQNKLSGGQITGMFYGIEAGVNSATNRYAGVGGYMDLYWRDLSTMSAVSVPTSVAGVRCGYDCANGFTQGEFLARLYFDTGMDATSSTNTLVGSKLPVSGAAFSGVTNSYASVDVAAGGKWSKQLDSNWFATATNQGARDLRFRNSYDSNANWNGPKVDGVTNIFGASLNDPGQAFVLPEPDALSLMGLAMAGMGLALRRRRRA
jgi:hypothetical protein